uniref:Flap endonuclease GEN chromatin organization modifier domain-containing protein n=1 Tax=Stegastes partitus TaxID=144197 RepID=A0A3B4Z792_9TELE
RVMFELLRPFSDRYRFVQWKEESTCVSDGVVKKVPHCNVCRHPGSVKAHERGGCVLCDSQRFCQPQDFDYQCPCDWHRYEQNRQALSFEANIRRYIIREFLVSKDKPVSHFKRRQPNMLLMQKFAHDKMEWPKHYTSEKVLVLMTYTALMNRKYAANMTSQIQPIRIFKPRVRNAVACFEVIWSPPEHYVFPEDLPAEDQQEVRTVEEEALFGVAYPEVVESYLRNKALAEENRTKSKTAVSDNDCKCIFADKRPLLVLMQPLSVQTFVKLTMNDGKCRNMTIKGASTQPEMLPPTTSNTHEAEVLILDSPVSQKQHRKEKEDGSSILHDYPKAPLAGAESEAAASPSVSAVIDALHLSDIDWDALSFTSSPTPQAAANQPTELQPNKTTDSHVRETEGGNAKQKTSGDVIPADSRSAPELCPLRDRLLMRNTAKALNQVNNDVVSKQLDYELLSQHSSKEQAKGPIPSKGRDDCSLSGKGSAVHKKEPLTHQTQSSKEQLMSVAQAQNKTKEASSGSRKPPQKYKFVRTAISSSAVPPQRCHSDPGQSGKKDANILQTTKKSVCMSVCSSSEDSDVENQQAGPHRPTKTKSTNQIKGRFISDLNPKPVLVPKMNKPAAKAGHSHQVPTSQSRTPASTTIRRQDVPPATLDDDDVLLQSPASPVTVLDSDDSVVGSESPLPLAERLRLKFLK